MTRITRPSRWSPPRWIWAGAAVLALACGAAAWPRSGPPPLLINESPSLPEGVYGLERRTAGLGATVAVAQPPAGRAYLAALGMPGEVMLIKRVAAVQGDRVCLDGERLTAGSQTRRVRRRDGQGRVLPLWAGCRLLGPGELFLLGDTPGSFDSRYFGPVHRDQVIGVYREIFTW
ncbi:S26 family signal peptidase [Phenylobacterium sp.]|uniref:S26 family signal peptidase n=1 Tax=Phenylobacterium sp. TaxID=1871053 RepID=UPI0030039AE5